MQHNMWNHVGETIMRRLKSQKKGDTGLGIYSDIVDQVQKDLEASKIGGHEAAMRIIGEVFRQK